MKNPSLPLDGLIVLGARLNPQGLPGRIARLRLEYALDLWLKGGASGYLLLTGGCSGKLPISEARAMAHHALTWAEARGGAELRERLGACLILEENSRSTRESARRTLPLVQELRLHHVGLVSDTLHLKRAHYLFRCHYRHQAVTLHPLAVPGVMKTYLKNRRYLWLTKMLLRESGAWLKVLWHQVWPRKGA
jgi:hypothetical protein|uniref:YdcF family protein n=1 Tax=Desulfobacca acetoxidans TaxID=60893 RepID=A0A7C5AL66_9BACT